nr:MAG TPA: hypothetical protein [Caudoviricetes sp.]
MKNTACLLFGFADRFKWCKSYRYKNSMSKEDFFFSSCYFIYSSFSHSSTRKPNNSPYVIFLPHFISSIN